jgi:hypothetical protein
MSFPSKNKPLFKSKLCAHHHPELNKFCNRGSLCEFAHGVAELRTPALNKQQVTSSSSSQAAAATAASTSSNASSSSRRLNDKYKHPLTSNVLILQRILGFVARGPADFIDFALVCRTWCDEVVLDYTISQPAIHRSLSTHNCLSWIDRFAEHASAINSSLFRKLNSAEAREVPIHFFKMFLKCHLQLASVDDATPIPGSNFLRLGLDDVTDAIHAKIVPLAARLHQSHFLHFLITEANENFTPSSLLVALKNCGFVLSDDCVDAIHQNRLRFRTQMCGYDQFVRCENKMCLYAHCNAELRQIPNGATRKPAKQTVQLVIGRVPSAKDWPGYARRENKRLMREQWYMDWEMD